MVTTNWIGASADLLGRGSVDERPVSGARLCGASADGLPAPAARTATAGRTGVPVGGTPLRLRPLTRQPIGHVVGSTTFENNGTTLGNLSPGRPQS